MGDIDYKLLVKILIEWSIKNKNYDMTYFMYSNFNIGIPVKFLYNLEDNNTFFSSILEYTIDLFVFFKFVNELYDPVPLGIKILTPFEISFSKNSLT